MVSVIHGGASLKEAVNYNERKVKKGEASFLDARFYLKDPGDLTFKQKLARLENLISLNDRVKINHFHASLNFVPGELISKQQLKQIASVYMDKIGFANQPYLLYEHHDAAHPHLHIVSTTIRPDGSGINLHNIGKIRSEKARREIENEFGLIKADGRKQEAVTVPPVSLQKVAYGKSETKKAMSHVLFTVLNSYHYCSLPELNAVLRQYNMMADRGSEDSRIFKNNGLVYTALDDAANRVGVPVKASDFYFKPTLNYLNSRFKTNEPLRLKHRTRLKNIIDFALLNQRHSLESLREALRKEGVQMLIRHSEKAGVYGITYVDSKTRCVFNGSSLGKPYSAKEIQQRCLPADKKHGEVVLSERERVLKTTETNGEPGRQNTQNFLITGNISGKNSSADTLIDDLFSSQTAAESAPCQLRKARRKKRKKLAN